MNTDTSSQGLAERDNRLLGFLETALHYARVNSPESSIVCQYASVEGSITKDIATQALFWLQKRFPLMQCSWPTFDKEDNPKHDFSFYDSLNSDADKISHIPLLLETQDKAEIDWQSLAKEEMTLKDFGKYLWRCRIVTNKDNSWSHIYFTTHHSISDARSLIKVATTFLEYYADLEKDIKSKPSGFFEGKLFKAGDFLEKPKSEEAKTEQP